MRYFKASWDLSYRGGLATLAEDIREYETWRGSIGRPFRKWDKKVAYIVKGNRRTDYVMGLSGWPLFSDRLKTAIEAAKLRGCRFHPVRIAHHRDRPIERFWFANILTRKGLLDMRKSMHFWIRIGPKKEERHYVLVKPVFRRAAPIDRDLVRLEEFPAGFYVSERFLDVYAGIDGRGLHFKEVPVA